MFFDLTYLAQYMVLQQLLGMSVISILSYESTKFLEELSANQLLTAVFVT